MSRDIPINLIDRDEGQPRQHFDAAALSELAQSIAANGLAVPILVRPAGERFVIVHGERRYRAVQSLGHETIAAEVRDLAPDEAHWLALVENVQRSDLSPIEEAFAYQARLAEGLTQGQLGQRIGKTQSYIATKLRFLKLPTDVQDGLDKGLITEGHAKQLLRLDDPKGMSALYTDIIALKSSVREVSEVIDHYEGMCDAIKSYLESIVEIGKVLRDIKRRLPPELWETYLQSPFLISALTSDVGDMLIALADKPPQRMDEVPDAVFAALIDPILEATGMSGDITPTA